MGKLADRVAIVTGAASGIGRATAVRFGAEGATVACVDVAADGANQTATDIAGAGGTAKSYACNVADPASVEAAVGAVLADFGRVDLLANVAGIGRFANSHEASIDEWNRIIAVNLTGSYLMARAVLPQMLERGSGVIINTASTAGLAAQPYSAAYCASKGGVVMLTKSLAWEYLKRGIRVNAVAPGGVDTPIVNSFGFPEDADLSLFQKIMPPSGVMAQPEEMASAFAYIASDEAKHMTGTVVVLDGGMTC